MEKLLTEHEVHLFREAIKQCKKDVYLLKNDKSEQFNLKSEISEFRAIGRLLEKHGDEYELFCTDPSDTGHMLAFFEELKQSRASALKIESLCE